MNQQTSLLCGEKELPLQVPDSVRIMEMKPVPALADPRSAVDQALREPIASTPLAQLAKGKKTACVVISDFTRPVPNRIILPPLLETLEQNGIPREGITILIATGMHRPNLGAELDALVGQRIAADYRVVNHYCRKSEEYRRVDTIDGAPIEINTHYLDAELKILTGLIEPHFYAGYSGGRKAILPGISSFETMKFMHSYQMIDHPNVTNCLIEGNPFHDYGVRVAERVGVDFILNVVINRRREIAGVFAGHFNEAHLAGCALVRHHSVVSLAQPMDLVITSGGGYPLDATFYQISKALIGAKSILKKGGTILVACECREGLGSPDFCNIIHSVCTPQEFFEGYCDPVNFVIDQWCAQNIYQALDHAGKFYLYSPGLSDDDFKSLNAIKVDDLQQTVDMLLASHERSVVVPDGPYTIGVIE
jgi:lactate racemase